MEAIKICASNAPVIQFRNKFQKLFNELPTYTQEGLKKVFARFIADKDNARAADILWKLTYSHFTGLSKLGLREKDAYTNDDILVLEDDCLVKGMRYESKHPIEIPTEMIEPLRNELRYQRKQVHPDFLMVNYPDGCHKAFKALLHASSDPIITYEVCVHCYQVCYLSNEIEINRILFLLGCQKKENVYGGIRSLRFEKYQVDCLLRYNHEIRDYLEACWVAVSAEFEPTNTPLAGQLEVWRNNHPDAISDDDTSHNTFENQSAEETSQSFASEEHNLNIPEIPDASLKSQVIFLESAFTDDFKNERPLTARNILDDSDIFNSLLNIAGNEEFIKSFSLFAQSVRELKVKGYNFTKAIEDLPHIEALLSARAILEGA